jgi:hypothetical protein
MPHEPVRHLALRERRDLARERHPGPAAASCTASSRLCLLRYGPLTNGSAVCSQECDNGWWNVVPTLNGELYVPAVDDLAKSAKSSLVLPAVPEPLRGDYPRRRARDGEYLPGPEDAATPEQEAYITSDRLRQRLVELNP